MYARFSDPEKAASYLASGLQKDFPGAVAEITFSSGHHARTATCEVGHIGPVLQQMCRRFPLASVDYHPENRYGFVGEIRCHGENKGTTVFQRHDALRPRVVVMLTQVEGRDVLVGSSDISPPGDGLSSVSKS